MTFALIKSSSATNMLSDFGVWVEVLLANEVSIDSAKQRDKHTNQ